MAEISIQHAFDLAAPRENRVPKLLQVGPAFGQRGGAVPKEGLALPGPVLIFLMAFMALLRCWWVADARVITCRFMRFGQGLEAPSSSMAYNSGLPT